ncbi:MAG: hypothetical protein B6243_01925 [Anaerolineaceae bacterium 4572_5.2]|nr:MAG: hypothetical protein B6243_01925 [Anaerolineaceae bacterium 4572_5.2]
MKIRMILIVALVIVLALPATLQAQEPDPTATIKAMEDALNAGDVDAAMAFFTDDAVVKLEFFGDTCTGADEIRVWFEELVAGNFQIQVEVLQIDGDTVTAKTTTWIDFTRSRASRGYQLTRRQQRYRPSSPPPCLRLAAPPFPFTFWRWRWAGW